MKMSETTPPAGLCAKWGNGTKPSST